MIKLMKMLMKLPCGIIRMVERSAAWLPLLLVAWPAAAQQTLTLQECREQARTHYPLVKKLDLIRNSSRYALAGTTSAYLPQLNISGQASYQSQTVDLGAALGSSLPPGISLPEISKDQYKIQADITQVIYDGGVTGSQRSLIRANEAIQQQQVTVALYEVMARVDQLYFSVLLTDRQLAQHTLRKADLQESVYKTTVALQNGVAFRSSLDELKAEMVNVDMSTIELQSRRTAALEMLGILTGNNLDDSVRLEQPSLPEEGQSGQRPELRLYDLQKERYVVEEKKLRNGYMPQLSLFFQGAYGRPALNFVDNAFGPWYVTGARLNWNLGSLYTLKNDKRTIRANMEQTDADRETFQLNTALSASQDKADIRRYRLLIEEDQKAVALRTSVKRSAQAQLDNGVITTHDFIIQLNAEYLARQTFILHEIQLLQALYQYKHTSGN